MRAFAGQPFGNGQADTDTAAGNHRNLVSETKIHRIHSCLLYAPVRGELGQEARLNEGMIRGGRGKNPQIPV
ncbi:hypothetical protein AA0535_2836 [Asaia krungthepensis NRIC 0535]|uniref:Uncharacterized protein n=1 Tax=Asaia krungthepensis NRIC 0535 TaxID=1307925 RepID=A0ABQ0Q6B8_9PROT|nr:hypothetical protein AA0535_2836 [Asaia krungthepensis NRIC 0535]